VTVLGNLDALDLAEDGALPSVPVVPNGSDGVGPLKQAPSQLPDFAAVRGAGLAAMGSPTSFALRTQV
jgi:hypothetical protein